MAKDEFTLAADASSDTITIAWPGMASVESDRPITIKTPSGSVVPFPDGWASVSNVITPEFIITAGPDGADVIVTTAD